jgi:hypothetical protein
VIFFWQKGFYFLSLCMILTLLVMTSPDLTAMLGRCMQFASAEGIGKAFGSNKIKPFGINGSRKK